MGAAMHFVDWCSQVLARVAIAVDASPERQLHGLMELEMDQAVWGETLPLSPGFHGSPAWEAVHYAVSALASVGLVSTDSMQSHVELTEAGRWAAKDPTDLWAGICSGVELDATAEALVGAVNRLSMIADNDYARVVRVEQVRPGQLLPDLDGPDAFGRLRVAAKYLDDHKLANCRPRMGAGGAVMDIEATYRGLVWETKRGWTVGTRFIDSLRAAKETANVDFKREVHTNSKDDKAELIKDILALANTPVSGASRWLIIGFEPKAYAYFGPPDRRITQEHLEDLLSEYTVPTVRVRYDRVDYRDGLVGQLEVLREPYDLPYQVKKSLHGATPKKWIEEEQVYIRHTSHSALADVDDIDDLRDEAERARQWRASQTTPS
jgi:hypothetical protein